MYLSLLLRVSRRSRSSSSPSRSNFSASFLASSSLPRLISGLRFLGWLERRSDLRGHRRLIGEPTSSPWPPWLARPDKFSVDRLARKCRTSTGLRIRGELQGEHCKNIIKTQLKGIVNWIIMYIHKKIGIKIRQCGKSKYQSMDNSKPSLFAVYNTSWQSGGLISISNKYLWKETNQLPIHIRKHKWKWIGHRLRQPDGTIEKICFTVEAPRTKKDRKT